MPCSTRSTALKTSAGVTSLPSRRTAPRALSFSTLPSSAPLQPGQVLGQLAQVDVGRQAVPPRVDLAAGQAGSGAGRRGGGCGQ